MATFGNTADGTDQGIEGANILDGYRHTLSEAGDVSKLSVRVSNDGASPFGIRGAIYAVSAGEPAALQGATTQTVVPASDPVAWRDLSFSVALSLTAADYYLCLWTDGLGSACRIYGAASGGTERYKTSTYDATNPPPDPFPSSPNTGSLLLAIYATYTTAAVVEASLAFRQADRFRKPFRAIY